MEDHLNNTSVQIGQHTITAIIDALVPLPFPAAHMFPSVSAAEWAAARQRYPQTFSASDALIGIVHCYLVRLPGRTILIDTGFGLSVPPFASGGQHSQLLSGLAQAGVAPAAIDTVFLTHMHPDHVGWNVQHAEGDARPTFPNARYVAHQADWEMCERRLAADPAGAAYVAAQLLPLRQRDLLTLVSGDTDLAEGVRAIHTPGHTPGHMSALIEPAGAGSLLVAGDAFAHPLQVAELAHSHSADADIPTAQATRARLLAHAEAADSIITATHFPAGAFGRVRRDPQGRYWQPL